MGSLAGRRVLRMSDSNQVAEMGFVEMDYLLELDVGGCMSVVDSALRILFDLAALNLSC